MLNAVSIISLLLAGLATPSPIKSPVDFSSYETQPDECLLPQVLDRYGRVKYLEDCKSLSRFDIPVPATPWGGSPRVCCPPVLGKNPICFESDAWCKTYKPNPEESYEYDYYDYGPGYTVSDLSITCEASKTTCVPVSRCGNIQSPQVNVFCGVQDAENLVCCAPEDVLIEAAPLPKPRFPAKGTDKARPCRDKTRFCLKWKDQGICDLDRDFETGGFSGDPKVKSPVMYAFVLLTCPQTCGLCDQKGCIDEHEQCPDWARQGLCLVEPYFMGHTCRESCGTCGYLSSLSNEDQDSSGNTYSNIQAADFDCGRFKTIEQLKDSGLLVERDEFNKKSAPDPSDGTCKVDEEKEDLKREEEEEEGDYVIANSDDFEIRGVESDTAANAGDSGSGVNCGLILISDRWMLSAAHCYDNFEEQTQLRVATLRSYLPEKAEVFHQKKVYIHPGYTFPYLYNDIALIQLDRRVQFDFEELGDTPSCLGDDRDVENMIGEIQGYGTTEDGDYGTRLGTLNLTLLDHWTCQDELINFINTARRSKSKKKKLCDSLNQGVREEHICGRGAPLCSGGQRIVTGTCKGDSGGPVETWIDGRKHVVGLVSGSISCISTSPEWYTKVGHFRDWIQCIMSESARGRIPKIDVEEKCARLHYKENKDASLLDICNGI